MLSARFIYLIGAVFSALAADVHAQCSASIPSGSQTICAGVPVTIPVTLSGTPPYTFVYDTNGASHAPITTSESTYNLVLEGLFQSTVVQLVDMEDGTGCQGQTSGVTTLQVNEPILIGIQVTNTSCLGAGNTGVIAATVDGGTPPYAFNWSGGLPNTQVVQNLVAGTYALTVTDANGCTATTSATVNQIYPVIVSMLSTPVSCTGTNDGSINLTVAGPASYLWSNGATTQDLTNLSAGTYRVTVTDNISGCTLVRQGSVAQSSTLVLSIVTTPATCSNSSDASVDLTVTGGTPGYTYLWSNGATTQDQNGLNAGVRTVTVTDANGCTQTASATTTTPSTFYSVPTVQQPTCGNNDGSIDLSIYGGTPPYQTLWSNGTTQEDLINVGTGAYSVTITDANGCSFTQTRSLGSFEVTIQYSAFQCLANLDLSVNGGTAPYTYLWSNGATTEDQTGLTGGTYIVTVTDALGCSAIRSISFIQPAQVSAYITTNTSACSGGLTAHIVGGGPSGADYAWSTGLNSQFLTNVPAGTYTVTVTSSYSCTASASITVNQPITNAQIGAQISTSPIYCYGDSTGSIVLDSAAFAPPLSFVWSTGATTRGLYNLPAGTYTATITDANGCSRISTRTLTQPQPITVNWSVVSANCNSNDGSINLFVSGGTPLYPGFYTYTWSNGATTQDLNNLYPGAYRVTVTDNNGCTYTSPDINVNAPVFSVEINALSIQCTNAVLTAEVSGGIEPFEYYWTKPNGSISFEPNLTASLSGTYFVGVTDASGCIAQAAYQLSLAGNGNCGYISGKVLHDEVENCLVDPGEPGLGGWLVRAESAVDTFYGVTNPQGNYWINVPTGTYTIAILPVNALWEVCPVGFPVTLDTQNDTVPGGNFPVKALYQCPSLSVSIGANMLRRCFSDNYYYVSYCNQGTTPAIDPYVLLTLDPLLSPVSSSIPYSNLGGGVLRFDVGDIAIGECRSFQLQVLVDCNATLGQTHCTEAHIYPDGNCLPTDPEWSGASLRLSSQCTQDSVRFLIENIGLGDMQSTSDYIVVEDAVMLYMQPFQLVSGASSAIAMPANGSTWRVQIDQVPFHPGLSAPALSLEGCTANPSFSTGYVNQFPNDDADPWVDIDCTQNSGSFDPNDKQGFPVGYGEAHYIRPGTELEYLIRFQNTGTDTAFTVRIVDTLSLWLDPATIRPGVSSHTYQFNFTGQGVAEFLFENIMLPDSNVNLAGSNGFVKFSIYPRADAPLETLIENNAAIYFDFNEPVITNTTRHRLGENFLMTVGAWQPQRPEYEVTVSPNPFSASARLEVKGLESTLPVHLQVFDLQGNVVHDETADGPVLELKKENLPTGLYLFRLDQKGVMIGSGKLVVRD